MNGYPIQHITLPWRQRWARLFQRPTLAPVLAGTYTVKISGVQVVEDGNMIATMTVIDRSDT